jgi:hypothetical protein
MKSTGGIKMKEYEVLKEARVTLFKGTKLKLNDKIAKYHLAKKNIKLVK